MPDTTSPGYLSTTPNAYVNWTLPLNTDFWFEMSESVQAGTGFITVTDGDGNSQLISVGSSNVRYVGQFVYVDVPQDLVQGKSYTVTVPYGAIVDASGNSATVMNGVVSPLVLTFTAGAADTTAPALTTTIPGDNEVDVLPTAGVRLEFSEALIRGTGYVSVYKSDGSLVGRYAITDTASVYVVADVVYLHPAPTFAPGSYYVTVDSGALLDMSNNAFAGITSADGFSFTVGIGAPRLSYVSPADDSTGVSPQADFCLYFNEPIKIGSGKLYLYNASDNSLVYTMDVSQAFVVDDILCFDTTVPLDYSSSYYILTDPGIAADVDGNAFAGITSATAFDFTTGVAPVDTTAPVLTGAYPADDATGAAATKRIILSFSEGLKSVSGTVAVHLASDGSIVESYTIPDTTGHIELTGTDIYIHLEHYLLPGTSYYVTVTNGAFADGADNAFAGITASTALNFTTATAAVDTTAPTLIWTSPSNNATSVPYDWNVGMQFSENVQSGTGMIELHRSSDGSLVESFLVTDRSKVTFNGDTVAFRPTAKFDPNTSYYVTMASGVIQDSAGNAYAGLSTSTGFAFKVTPTIPVWSPLTIEAGSTVTLVSGDQIALIAYKLYDYPHPAVPAFLTNKGTVNITGAQNRGFVTGVAYEEGGYFDGCDFVNAAGATFTVAAPNLTTMGGGGVAYVFNSLEWNGDFYNYGTITLTSNAFAVGVSTPTTSFKFVNAGTLSVSGRLGADGFSTMHAEGTVITNGGDLEVTSSGGYATGFSIYAACTITNTGTIRAVGAAGSTAIESSHMQGFTMVITNAGLISADIAIACVDAFIPPGTPADVVDNSGTIQGIIYLGYGDDAIHNSGTIDGDVYLDSGNDTFDGSRGVQYGIVFGGTGCDTLLGGAGTDAFNAGDGADLLSGGAGDDYLFGGDDGDTLTGGSGNDTLEGGTNVDTAIFSGNKAAYTITQTSTGVFQVAGPDGTDILKSIEYAKFDDQTMRLLPGTGATINWSADPSTYMTGIRDFDGNDLGSTAGWKLIGTADVNGDGTAEHILVNRQNGRWAEISTEADGKTYFGNNGWAGDTRVVGIYIDPLVTAGIVQAGSDTDSQRRFQNDLNIENIHGVLGQNDYNHDGLQEIYFSLTDGTAYLHAYMHADGNIQYANYQNEQQVKDYLTSNGFTAAAWAGWFPSGQTTLAAVAA